MNDRVIELAEFFELGDESPDGTVCIVDGAVVDGSLIVQRTILGDDLVGGCNDGVRFIEPDVDEKWCVGSMFVDPVNGFIDNELAGVTFHGPNGFTVAQKVGGIFVTRMSTIDQAEPVVESMIGRGGIAAPVNRHAEMPLAKVSGAEAFAFQDLGECRFTPKEMHFVTLFTEDGIDSGADVVTASEKSGTGRRADRRPGVEVGEPYAFGSQPIEYRCLDGTPVTANVAVAEIVNEESDDIWWFAIGKNGTNRKKGK